MEKGVPVKLEMDVKNSFYDDNPQSFNVVGEIPGTDKANEIVMLGAHFDSWHGGTGATDNAAGSAVMMEAMGSSSRAACVCVARCGSDSGAVKNRGCSARAPM
jgi:Iap family predicted aminopeptidase